VPAPAATPTPVAPASTTASSASTTAVLAPASTASQQPIAVPQPLAAVPAPAAAPTPAAPTSTTAPSASTAAVLAPVSTALQQPIAIPQPPAAVPAPAATPTPTATAPITIPSAPTVAASAPVSTASQLDAQPIPFPMAIPSVTQILSSHATEVNPDGSLNSENYVKSSEGAVMGDSKTPLIDRSSIEMIHSMVFTEGNPADRLPWKTSGYYHFAKNQDLKELIRNFCAAQSMDAIVSDDISDVVNGKFSDVTPCQFWKDIVSAYGLVWFFDGSMMYAYKSSEVTSAVYQMNRDEMRTLVRVITQLGWLSSNVTFRPLETAGILVVSGPPKLMSLLEELSKKVVIERVSNVYDIRSFPLKHAWAYDMSVNYRGGNMTIPGVATMLQQIVGALPGPVGDSNIGVSIDNSQSNTATEKKAIPGTVYHTNEPKKTDKSKNEGDKNSGKNEEKNPLNLSEIFVTHDTRLNAVIVKAKRQDMSFIENIIQQLDVPRDAIKIDVAVVEISKAGAIKIGSTFAINKRDTSAAAGGGAAAGGAAAGGTERIAFNFIDRTNASVTMNFDKLFRNYSLSETLNILEDVGNAQTLTRSSVITLDNIGAVIDRSSTVYMAVTGAKAGGLYDVTISTKLIVVPHIIPGEFDRNGAPKIKLLIEVTDGSFDKDARINANSPATATNSVNTEASLFEGQSLFIGGYFHEVHSVGSAGVPFLKDIPLIGYLFKSDSRDNSIMERIYIITPSIVSMDDPKRTKLNRFFTDGQLAGEPTLKSDEFILTHDYERPSFENATFKQKPAKFNLNKIFQKDDEDQDTPEPSEIKKWVQHKNRTKTYRRR
jgi:type III secretion protein C